jgi:hypothetical protein
VILGADPDCKDCRGKGSTYGQRCDCTTRAPRDAEIARLRAALAAGPAALRARLLKPIGGTNGVIDGMIRAAFEHALVDVEAAQKKAMGET